MGEHKFVLCHDEECYFDMQKLSWHHMAHVFENDGSFDRTGRCERAVALMNFINDHRDCHLEWRGEYGGNEFNNEGFPPKGYADMAAEYLDNE